MAELKNTFSWSVSRDRCFRGCRRDYFYTYYGYWGGWALSAPEEIRQIYILKNMVNFPLWGGSIVHDIIKDALTQYCQSRILPELQQMQQAAVETLRNGWRQSRAKLWQKDPKRAVNLYEHYYGEAEGRSVSQEEADAFKAGIMNAIEAFYHSDTLGEILSLPQNSLRSVDRLENFPVECDGVQVPVWCAIDLAYVDGRGRLHVVDWKTGREHKDELLRQLAFYAKYAMEKWHVPFEDILLEGVILNDGGRVSPYFLSPGNVSSAMEQMHSSVRQMKQLLQNQEENAAEKENFKPCAIPERCENCRFKELCRREFEES